MTTAFNAINLPEVSNRAFLDMVFRMACLAQYRVPNIAAHIERIRGYTYILARGYGLPIPEVELLSYASQLHDIGEVSLPDSLATRAGKLTDAELERVKLHTLIGAKLLNGSASSLLQAGEIIAVTHHERWDGSGYPYGLKGDQIPLSGRIVALADIFDALTTERSYKKELPVEDALLLIVDNQSILFDPELVEVFNNTFEDILKTRQAHL